MWEISLIDMLTIYDEVDFADLFLIQHTDMVPTVVSYARPGRLLCHILMWLHHKLCLLSLQKQNQLAFPYE